MIALSLSLNNRICSLMNFNRFFVFCWWLSRKWLSLLYFTVSEGENLSDYCDKYEHSPDLAIFLLFVELNKNNEWDVFIWSYALYSLKIRLLLACL